MGNRIKSASKEESSEEVFQVKEFFANTSLHGVRYFNEKGFFRKIVWFLALGAAMGVCGKQVYDTLHAFYRLPFSTTLTRHRASAMDFPAVTICNLNMISKKQYATAVKKLNLMPGSQNQTEQELREEIQAILSLLSFRDFKTEYLQKSYSKLFQHPLFDVPGPTFTNFLKAFSHSIEGMLSLDWLSPCRWRGRTCTPLNFTAFVTLRMGQCYTFNSGKGYPKLKSVVSGPSNGLRLKLNLEEKDHVNNDFTLESGFKVLVHDQNEYPMIEEAEGFALQPGTHTFAALRQTRYKNLAKPYKTNCASPDKPFNKYFNFSYSINACVEQCIHEYNIKTCGCQALYNITPGVEVCSMRKVLRCIYDIQLRGDFPDEVVKCSNNCPEPCEYKKYETKLSYAAPVSNAFSRAVSSRIVSNDTSESFKNFLSKSEKDRQEFIRNNVVSLDVFFESLGYDIIEQKPLFDDWALLGAVGGTLGLFLGTSILTVLEFLDFLAVCLIRALRRNRIPPKENEIVEINHSITTNHVVTPM